MSDLLSPIYVVFDAEEADAFWALVGVMRMMVSCIQNDQIPYKVSKIELTRRRATFCAIKVV
jgi:hypothetical protein